MSEILEEHRTVSTQAVNGLRLAIKAAGNANRLAGKLGVSRQAVQQWRRIPTKRIIEVEAVTGVPRERLRRDLY